MKTILTLALTAAAIAFSGTPAFAQQASSSVAISYADLDLGTSAGIRRLDRRIRTAVELACGPVSSFDPAGKNDVRQCRAETLAAARVQRDLAIAAVERDSQVQLAAQR